MKPRILFIVQLPNPVHGVTLMNKYTVEYEGWHRQYDVKTLPLNFGQKLDDIGKITPGKLFRLIGFVFRLFYVMATFRPSLVYFTIVPTGKIFYRDALFTWVIKLFRPRIIFHLHKKGVEEIIKKSPRKRWLYKRTFNGVQTICLSERLTHDIRSVYAQAPFILPNGIKVVSDIVVKRENDVPQVLYLSNLIKSKGILVFLHSLAELKRRGFVFKAKIIGEAIDFTIDEAKAFCAKHGLSDTVEVVGPKFDKDKFDELRRSDIFVLPSYNECLPLSILEAMQFGLPVISTPVGGIPDIISHGVTGLLIKPGSVKDLTGRLQQLIGDKNLRYELGANARRQFIERYTLDTFYDGLSDIFEQVLHDKKRPRLKIMTQMLKEQV